MEALGVETGSLLCRLARHFQTGVYIVAIVTAVSSVRYERILFQRAIKNWRVWYNVPCSYIFRKLPSSRCYATFDMLKLRLTVFEIFIY